MSVNMAARPKKASDLSTYSGRFAARLRAMREKAGLTVEEFGEAISAHGYAVAVRTIYAWESGRNDPPLDAFPAIAKAVNVKRIRDLLPPE